MEENIDELMMRKFVHKVFRKSNNIGSLTVKSVRQQFLEYLGLEKLVAEQKEVFKSIVHDIYNLYSNENQEQNGDRGSSLEDSYTTTETDNVCDLTVSCSSVSSRKKREHGIDNDEDSQRGEISNHNNNMSEEEKQKGKTVSEKEVLHKIDGERGQRKKKITSKKKASQAVDKREESTGSNSEEEQSERTNGKSGKKRSWKINDDTEVDDSKGNEEAPRKNNGSKKITPQKMEDDADSNDSCREEEVPRKKNTFKEKRSHKIDEQELSGVSNSEDQRNEEQDQGNESNHDNTNVHKNEDNTRKKKVTKKSKDTSSRSADKKKTLPPPAADSIRLKNLKRFVRTCGLHKNYVKLFSECDSMSQKEETLERVLRKDTGFQGRITLSMCKKFKLAKEEADELAELDCSNIITADGGRRATRRTRVGSDNQLTPSTVLNSDSPKLFSRLKGVVDSDGSDSEEKQRRGKHALSACPKNQYRQENSRKRRRLNSSSDEDGD